MTKPAIVQDKYIGRIHKFCLSSVSIDRLGRHVCIRQLGRHVCIRQCPLRGLLDKHAIIYELNVIDGAMIVNLITVIF